MENDVLYNRIMNVVHEEYGEGSTAVANPEGEPTDALEKIQIGDDVYSISGGGGGGVLIIEPDWYDDRTEYNVSYNELKDAFLNGKSIVMTFDSDFEGTIVHQYYPLTILAISDVPSATPCGEISFTYTEQGITTTESAVIEDPDADIVVNKE